MDVTGLFHVATLFFLGVSICKVESLFFSLMGEGRVKPSRSSRSSRSSRMSAEPR
jgi:hypothetical protein